jgi:hypothetical protein
MYIQDAMSPVLSKNSTVANMCHTQALEYKVTIASLASWGHSWNSSCSHLMWTSASHPFMPDTFAGGSRPRKSATLLRHVAESTRPMTGRPLIDNPRIIPTSRGSPSSCHTVSVRSESPASTYAPLPWWPWHWTPAYHDEWCWRRPIGSPGEVGSRSAHRKPSLWTCHGPWYGGSKEPTRTYKNVC